MIRNSYNFNGSSAHAGYKTSRWRTVFIALVLALSIGNTGQTLPAQAQPPDPDNVNYQFAVAIVSGPRMLCVGGSKEFRVSIVEKESIGPSEPFENAFVTLAGKTEIIGVAQNANIANFTSANHVLINSPSARGLRPSQVTFTVKGKEEGEARFSFSGNVEYYNNMIPALSPDDVWVKVVICKYKVHIVSKWKAGMTSVGTTDGILEVNDNGTAYSGDATVSWTTTKLCGITSPISPSKADLNGSIDQHGKLVVGVTFGPISSVGGGNCSTASVETSNAGTPDPLKFTIPADATAKVFNKVEPITAKNGKFTGSATIIVTPLQQQ